MPVYVSEGDPVNSTSLIRTLTMSRCQQVQGSQVSCLKSADTCAQISVVTRASSKPENSLMVASRMACFLRLKSWSPQCTQKKKPRKSCACVNDCKVLWPTTLKTSVYLRQAIQGTSIQQYSALSHVLLATTEILSGADKNPPPHLCSVPCVALLGLSGSHHQVTVLKQSLHSS